jgi:PAS domain S-box-containing protein
MRSPAIPNPSSVPAALQENEARYRLLTEALPQYVWTTDAEGKIDYCNRHLREYFGLAVEEIRAGRVLEFIHPDDLPELSKKAEHSRATGEAFEREYRVRRAADGEYRWHFAHAEQFDDADGRKRWLGVAVDVTSHKQTEFELRAANEQLNGILGSISESFIALDYEWRIRYVSQRVLNATHLTWPEIGGRVMWDLFPDAARTGFKAGYEKVMRERAGHTFDVTYPNPDGTTSYFLVHAYPTPEGIAALVSDVTERKTTESDLAESKRLLHLVLDTAGVGTWVWHLASDEITDLANTGNLLGLDRVTHLEEIIRVLHPGDRLNVEARLAEARTTGRLYAEHRIVLPDGSERRLRAMGSLLREQNGLPARIAGVVTDVTDRNRAEEARSRLAAIVDSSDDAIISKDLNGIVTTWNAGATHLFGWRPEEIIGKSILTLIPLELHSEEPAILATMRGGRKIDHYETVRIHKDGTRLQVSLTISPVRDFAGRIVGASKIARDVGERLRMQEAMIQSEKLAATGRMAAAIAHEINNPLEAVTNLAYLLSTDPTLSETGKKFAELLLEEISRVNDVAKQSLGFFRDGKKPGPFDLCELLDSVVRLYRPLLEKKGIELTRDFDAECSVHGSSAEIRQVFANLVRNAIEAVEAGGRIQLRVRTTRMGMRRIMVADNGRGIDPHTRDRLFQPFVTSKGAAGNGLGLWVSQGIVKKHGGRIHVKTCDIPGRSGTVFSVLLPTKDGQQAQDFASGIPATLALLQQRLAS